MIEGYAAKESLMMQSRTGRCKWVGCKFDASVQSALSTRFLESARIIQADDQLSCSNDAVSEAYCTNTVGIGCHVLALAIVL